MPKEMDRDDLRDKGLLDHPQTFRLLEQTFTNFYLSLGVIVFRFKKNSSLFFTEIKEEMKLIRKF